MKNLVLILALFSFSISSFSQVQINATVKCPPCRPVSACGICWENQTQAQGCNSSSQKAITKDQNSIILKIVSNPVVNGNLSLESNQIIQGKIIIFDQLGRVIKEINIPNNETNLYNAQLGNSISGLHFMIYYNSLGERIVTKKLVFVNQ